MGQEDCCCLATASDLHSSRMMSQADPPVKALLQSEQRSSRTRHPSRKDSHHLYVRIQMTIAKPRSPHSCKTPKSTVLFFFGTTCSGWYAWLEVCNYDDQELSHIQEQIPTVITERAPKRFSHGPQLPILLLLVLLHDIIIIHHPFRNAACVSRHRSRTIFQQRRPPSR